MIILQNIFYILSLFQISSSLTFDSYRLPTNIKPINYKLSLKVNPENSYYTGKIQILLNVLNGTTSVLFLHADRSYITIDSIELNGTNCSYSLFNDITHIFPVKCLNEYRSGQELVISYKGKFSQDMSGFYKSTYDDKILVATMFEPIYARRAFPCFDEPSFKATFEVSVEHPNRYNVLANTLLLKEVKTRNSTITHFEKTPIMSTYLVAIIISQFEGAIKKDQNFNVFARASAAANMGVATTYGRQLFDYMSQWTAIRYEDLGNSQQFLVAIPDFAAGAMENWGLVNFREVDLLDDGTKTSNSSFQTILMVMSHEIAHQWFGNYVTLDWWSNIWLNEGLAEYFGKVIANMVNNGTLEIDDQFVVDIMQEALHKDSVISSNPLSSPEKSVRTDLEINTKLDEISYYKGASIVRMMAYVLGEETFKRGIQDYLTQNKFKNVNPGILLEALQVAAGTNIDNFKEKMHNWIYQPGFPLVSVFRKNDTTVTITQERFTLSGNSNLTAQWHVPISYTTGKLKNFSVKITNWLEPNTNLEIQHDSKDWFILNLQESGFYRVNYDNDLWDAIVQALNTESERNSIHPLNRAQIIFDIFQIAKIGKISYEKVFKLIRFLKKETSYYPWMAALRSFTYLLNNLEPEAEKLLKEKILNMITSAFPSNTKYTTHIDVLKKTEIMEFACRLNQKKCLAYAKEQFEDFKRNRSSIDVNMKYVIFCYGLMESDKMEEDFSFLLNYFKISTSAHEKFTILLALGCTQNENLLNRYLQLTLLQPSPIRQQDFATVFNSVYYNNKMGTKVALDFIENHFKRMEIAYGGADVLSSLMLDIAEKISSYNEIEKMRKILNKYNDTENVKLVGPSVAEVIISNQQWKSKFENKLMTLLSENSGFRYNINMLLFLNSFILIFM